MHTLGNNIINNYNKKRNYLGITASSFTLEISTNNILMMCVYLVLKLEYKCR